MQGLIDAAVKKAVEENKPEDIDLARQVRSFNSSDKTIGVNASAVDKDGNVVLRKTGIRVNASEAYEAGWVAGYNAAADKFYKSSFTVYGPGKTSAYNKAPSAHYKVNYTASKHSYTPSEYKASSFSGPATYVASSYKKEEHSYTASSCSIGDKES